MSLMRHDAAGKKAQLGDVALAAKLREGIAEPRIDRRYLGDITIHVPADAMLFVSFVASVAAREGDADNVWRDQQQPAYASGNKDRRVTVIGDVLHQFDDHVKFSAFGAAPRFRFEISRCPRSPVCQFDDIAGTRKRRNRNQAGLSRGMVKTDLPTMQALG